jgi:hypothetical protein
MNGGEEFEGDKLQPSGLMRDKAGGWMSMDDWFWQLEWMCAEAEASSSFCSRSNVDRTAKLQKMKVKQSQQINTIKSQQK